MLLFFIRMKVVSFQHIHTDWLVLSTILVQALLQVSSAANSFLVQNSKLRYVSNFYSWPDLIVSRIIYLKAVVV